MMYNNSGQQNQKAEMLSTSLPTMTTRKGEFRMASFKHTSKPRTKKQRLKENEIFDRSYLGSRTASLNKSSSRKGSFGRIPPQDIHLKMELQNWTCMYCKDKISLYTCHFDHIWPIYHGGETYLYNIAITCRYCNITKRARSLKKFCKIMGFDYESIVQEIAEINYKLHELVNWNDGYGMSDETFNDPDGI